VSKKSGDKTDKSSYFLCKVPFASKALFTRSWPTLMPISLKKSLITQNDWLGKNWGAKNVGKVLEILQNVIEKCFISEFFHWLKLTHVPEKSKGKNNFRFRPWC
jgi:hypothetical protein